jgi:probable phosphomutase (TIGR03848 family)
MARSASHKPALVLLVRHGQTPTTGAKLPGRAPDLHLSEHGQGQAEATAERVGALRGVAAVYASPMERARETAAPIAEAVGRSVTVEAGLNECDFGEWTGRRLSDLAKRKDWRQVQRTPSQFRFPGGESFLEMQVRMVQTVETLRRRDGGRTQVAVSHADTIKATVAHAMGTPLDLFQRIVISPCSVTAILATDDGPVVLAVNEVGGDLTRLAPS